MNAQHRSNAKRWVQPCDKCMQDLDRDPKSEPNLILTTMAQITGAWTTTDTELLQTLQPFHIWASDFYEQRLNWRNKQPVTILELKVRETAEPIMLKSLPAYWGCFSWVDLQVQKQQSDQMWETASPVFSSEQFANLQSSLRNKLKNLERIYEIL